MSEKGRRRKDDYSTSAYSPIPFAEVDESRKQASVVSARPDSVHIRRMEGEFQDDSSVFFKAVWPGAIFQRVIWL